MQIQWEGTRTDCRFDKKKKKKYYSWVKLVTTQNYSNNTLLASERTVDLTDK